MAQLHILFALANLVIAKGQLLTLHSPGTSRAWRRSPKRMGKHQDEALNPGEIGRNGATPDRERSVSPSGAALTRVEVL